MLDLFWVKLTSSCVGERILIIRWVGYREQQQRKQHTVMYIHTHTQYCALVLGILDASWKHLFGVLLQ